MSNSAISLSSWNSSGTELIQSPISDSCASDLTSSAISCGRTDIRLSQVCRKYLISHGSYDTGRMSSSECPLIMTIPCMRFISGLFREMIAKRLIACFSSDDFASKSWKMKGSMGSMSVPNVHTFSWMEHRSSISSMNMAERLNSSEIDCNLWNLWAIQHTSLTSSEQRYSVYSGAMWRIQANK